MFSVEQCNAVAEFLDNYITFFTAYGKGCEVVPVSFLINLFNDNKNMLERQAGKLIAEMAREEKWQ